MKARMRQRGASLPETVIVMGVLLAMIFGIIDFGRATYTYAFVAQLARQGARWAIVRGSSCTALDHCNATQDQIQTYVRSLSTGATDPTQIKIPTNGVTWGSCPPGFSNNAPGCTVTVTVNYPFTFMLPYLPKSGIGQPMTIQMSSTSQMVVSQ